MSATLTFLFATVHRFKGGNTMLFYRLAAGQPFAHSLQPLVVTARNEDENPLAAILRQAEEHVGPDVTALLRSWGSNIKSFEVKEHRDVICYHAWLTPPEKKLIKPHSGIAHIVELPLRQLTGFERLNVTTDRDGGMSPDSKKMFPVYLTAMEHIVNDYVI